MVKIREKVKFFWSTCGGVSSVLLKFVTSDFLL